MNDTLAISLDRRLRLVQVHPYRFKVLVKCGHKWLLLIADSNRERITRSFLLQLEARA